MQDFEKLGVFYLGREYDLAKKAAEDSLILYDSKDLVTHAVCVGMTGSGKTGLCVSLIEEAAIDGIPSILIDPKGDLCNLFLTFPQLRGEDFLPWVNAEDAAKKGLGTEEYANQQAALWKKGLSDWGEDGTRIQRLRDAAEFVIYTPGSNAGVPVSILKSFAVPPFEIMDDGELLQERINTTVTSLLGMVGINADPLTSREHILISTIIGQSWRDGRDLDLASLIQSIQTPPMTRIGVLDLESFYSAKDRFGLVLALNNLVASPGFASWMEGAPLDIGQIIYTPKGKPRVAIFSIAHLGDAERMFFVSLLLNQVLGWMRTQSGTTSLRALVYMDEIFGYFPPIANPPSKLPLLTLLKQARAFGVGIVLATQNPVDLDYKGLSNAGTWFIGRLQTERDKARVMDGLEGAAVAANAGFDRARMEQIISGLGNRVFLMNNTHEDAPVVFTTRWAMSYLRGPLTRSQIKTLMDPYKARMTAPAAATAAKAAPVAAPVVTPAPAAPAPAEEPAPTPLGKPLERAAATPAQAAGLQPTLPPDVSQFFVPVRGSGGMLVYQPRLVAAAKIRYADAKSKVDTADNVIFVTTINDAAVPVNWEESEAPEWGLKDLEKAPSKPGQFVELPTVAGRAKSYVAWSRDFVDWAYSTHKLELFRSPGTGAISNPGESERDFRVRLSQVVHEQRDEASDTLRKKYAPKLAALQEKIRRAELAVDREKNQASQAKMQTAISVGATIIGAFLGRKSVSSSTIGKATTAARGVGRAMQQGDDVTRAQENVQAMQQQLADLEADLKAEVDALAAKNDPATEDMDSLVLKPKKSDIAVQLFSLVWTPYWQSASGALTPAW